MRIIHNEITKLRNWEIKKLRNFGNCYVIAKGYCPAHLKQSHEIATPRWASGLAMTNTMNQIQKGTLILQDGTRFEGRSVGSPVSTAGEVVFTTGMVGYVESMTDPSYRGQILTFTYPLIGNYGVPDKKYWESESIHVKGVVLTSAVDENTHYQSKKSYLTWVNENHIPVLEIDDTRLLTQHLRDKGVVLGKIIIDKTISFYDPNRENLVSQVSTGKIQFYGNKKGIPIVVIDCGVKRGIIESLVSRGLYVMQVPWNYDIFSLDISCKAVVISNGPGDPKQIKETIATVQKCVHKNIPILGICLGNQILALACGGDTKKMKFGHRSQNQPCRIEDGTNRHFLTSQNHGFEVSKIPMGFKPWFTNANDRTNEGIIHKNKPFMSVQFHPEGRPGPTDTEWVFDHFITQLKITN